MFTIIYQHKFIKACLSGLLLFLFIGIPQASAERFNTQTRYLYVQAGQSVFNIVRVLYPEQRKHWPVIIKKIVKTNPHAFIGADASKIQAGQRIKLPTMASTIKTAKTVAVTSSEPEPVGQVVKKRGKSFVIDVNGKNRSLDLGAQVFVGERIYTGMKGFIRLSMIDEAKIDLRCNSEMLIEDYQLVKGGNRSVIHLIKGSVNKITGSIGKMAEDIYEMHTPLATVGVRGTEYAIRVLQSHGCDGSMDVNSQGLFVKVKKGGVTVNSEQQKVQMQKGEAAHLADQQAKLQSIEAREGVFGPVNTERKSVFLGSLGWFVFMLPFIPLLRRRKS